MRMQSLLSSAGDYVSLLRNPFSDFLLRERTLGPRAVDNATVNVNVPKSKDMKQSAFTMKCVRHVPELLTVSQIILAPSGKEKSQLRIQYQFRALVVTFVILWC
jgi:hypothetical protein